MNQQKGDDSTTVPNFVTSVCCLVGASATQKQTLKKHIVPTQNEGENARLSSGVNSDVDGHQKQPWLKKKQTKSKNHW